ncbi:MAG: hypothetical protein AAF371_03115 [Pseudomonadota bacterium]
MTTDTSTPWPETAPEDRAFWAPRLDEGESLLWAGRPDARAMGFGGYLGRMRLAIMVFAILPLAAALSAVFHDARGDPGALVALIVLSAFLLAWSGWFWPRRDLAIRRGLRYAVTDRRMLAADMVRHSRPMRSHRHSDKGRLELDRLSDDAGWVAVDLGGHIMPDSLQSAVMRKRLAFSGFQQITLRRLFVLHDVPGHRRLYDALRTLPAYRD